MRHDEGYDEGDDEGNDDGEENEGRPSAQGNDDEPLDEPWYGTPWPTYLPQPDGKQLPLTVEGARQCVGPGWHHLINRAFLYVKSVSRHGIDMKGVMHMQGALQFTLINHNWTGDPFRASLMRSARYGLEAALHRLGLESSTTCEICAQPAVLTHGPTPGAVTSVCFEHAMSLSAGVAERTLWVENGWRAPVRVASWPWLPEDDQGLEEREVLDALSDGDEPELPTDQDWNAYWDEEGD